MIRFINYSVFWLRIYHLVDKLVEIMVWIVLFLDGTEGGILRITSRPAFRGGLSGIVNRNSDGIDTGIVAGSIVDVEEGVLRIGEAHHGTAHMGVPVQHGFHKVSILFAKVK